jgi:hypothetical protein
MTNHLSDEDLILIYYNEPGADRGHLAQCEECRRAVAALTRVLDSCNDWRVPEPHPELARGTWARIVPFLDVYNAPKRPWRWLYAACAVAAVLLLAFAAGRYSQRSQPSIMAGLSPQAQRRILEITLSDHLDRAEMLLTEISNTSEPIDRTRAQDLVDEGRLLRQTLARDGDSAPLAMLDELERFMLEAANAPEGRTGELRDRIASDSLLFKVRIIESNLRTEGQRL